MNTSFVGQLARLVVVVCWVAMASSGCASILGIEDVSGEAPPPPDGGSAPPDGGSAPPDSRGMVTCDDSRECSGTTPICDDRSNICRACSASTTECEGSPDGNLCSSMGSCVECLDNADCTGMAAPICGAELSCRGCQEHDECGSGVCSKATGVCANAADVVYVGGPDSNDAGTCTKNVPCTTIAYASGQLSETRSTMLVAPGTYNQQVRLPRISHHIIGYGAVIDGSGIDGTNRDGLVESDYHEDVIIEGLTVENSPTNGVYCNGGTDSMPTLTLRNVTISSSVSAGITHNQTCFLVLEDSVVRGSNSGDNGAAITWIGGGLTLDRSHIVGNPNSAIVTDQTEILIQNSLITNNGSNNYNRTFRIFGDATAGDVVIRYSTIAYNSPGCVATVSCQTSQSVTIDSNIIWGNLATCGPNVSPCSGPDYVLSNNIIEDVSDFDPVPDGNITDDPLFVASGEDDFGLQPTSPGIDSGTAEDAPAWDFNGNPRPSGAGPDIGALESPEP